MEDPAPIAFSNQLLKPNGRGSYWTAPEESPMNIQSLYRIIRPASIAIPACLLSIPPLWAGTHHEDFASASAADKFTDIGSGTWGVSSGRYVISSPGSAGAGLLGNMSIYEASIGGNDYALSATVNITGSSELWNDAALIFGYQDEDNYYYVSLNENNDSNTNGLLKVSNGTPSELADFSSTFSSDTDYTVEVQRTGSSIVVRIDSVQVASVNDSTFTGGKIGFGTKNDAAQFDNLVLEVPGELTLYSEAFNNESDPLTDILASDMRSSYAWTAHVGSTALLATDPQVVIANSAGGPAEDGPGFIVYAHAGGVNLPGLVWTEDFSFDPTVHSNLSFSFYAANSNAAHELRVALRINGAWYASEEVFSTSSGSFSQLSGGEYKELTFDTSGSEWRSLSFDGSFSSGGSTLSLGSTLGSSLPAGNITAFGIYMSSTGTGGNLRFDTFTITSGASDTQAPSVPQNLTAQTIDQTFIDLVWSASTDNVGVAGYRVYTDGSNPKNVSGTSTTMGNLTPDTTYSFTVSAYDAAENESAQSTALIVSTDEEPPPPPDPEIIGAIASTDDGNVASNTLDGNLGTRWSGQGDGAWIEWELNMDTALSGLAIAFHNGASRVAYFDIEVSLNGTTWTQVFSGESSGTTTNLEEFYFTEVTARYIRYVGHGNSQNDWNSLTEVEILVDEAQPTPPTTVNATAVSSAQINLSWSGAGDDIAVAEYDIYRNAQYLTTVEQTSYQDTGLSADTTYTYTIYAVDYAGKVSNPSSAAQAKTHDLSLPTTTQLSQYGITWTFSTAVPYGQYVTGDYYVVGPVTVVSISPAPTGTRNGSSVNPMGNRQGYDDRTGRFNTTDNPTLPFVLYPGDSLVSSVSKPDGATIQNVGCLVSQAVLTAVSTAQPADAFRPGYAGTYKATFTVSDINWSLLPDLTPPNSAPDGPTVVNSMSRPRIDHIGNWTIQHGCAEENWISVSHPCYGRDYSSTVSRAAMFAMLDTQYRDDVTINLIQLGIDNYSVLRAGGGWPADGGHHSARLWPIVFAAALLDDPDMQLVGADYGDKFGENDQTYYGTNGTPLWGRYCSNPQYFLAGCTGSGAKDCRDPDGLVDGCQDYRNCCTSHTWVGQMLAALMIPDAQDIWDHDAYFDYVDRWMSGGVTGGGGAGSTFIADMWNTYRSSY